METGLVLPYIPEKRRIIPNDLIRSALFTVSNHNRSREYIKNKQIYTFGQTQIMYTGEELRQDDEDVWLQLIYLASNCQVSLIEDKPTIEFMPYRFISALGWPGRTQYRDKLKMIIERMTASSVSISNKQLQAGISFSLVRKFVWCDQKSHALKKWRIWLEPESIRLFSGNLYSKILWDQRKKLKPLAKWLHSYYSSHAEPYPIVLPILKKACGSKMKALKHFREAVRNALLELTQVGFLTEFHIDAANCVHVVRSNNHRAIGYNV